MRPRSPGGRADTSTFSCVVDPIRPIADNAGVKILFFGSLGERLGRELDFDLPGEGCSVAELRARLAATLPELAGPSVRACIDRELAAEDAWVLPRHEVAFIPPLSGG